MPPKGGFFGTSKYQESFLREKSCFNLPALLSYRIQPAMLPRMAAKVGGDQDVERTNDVWTWTLLVCGDESHTGYYAKVYL